MLVFTMNKAQLIFFIILVHLSTFEGSFEMHLVYDVTSTCDRHGANDSEDSDAFAANALGCMVYLEICYEEILQN